jgi:hypothetical protein
MILAAVDDFAGEATMRRLFELNCFRCDRRHSCSREADAVDGLPPSWNDAMMNTVRNRRGAINDEAKQEDVVDAIY